MPKPKNVVLTHQNFNEAGGINAFPNLEIEGILQVVTYNENYTFEYLIESAFEKLKLQAKKKGCSHIFGIEYLPYNQDKHPCYGQDYIVRGTGYKQR